MGTLTPTARCSEGPFLNWVDGGVDGGRREGEGTEGEKGGKTVLRM